MKQNDLKNATPEEFLEALIKNLEVEIQSLSITIEKKKLEVEKLKGLRKPKKAIIRVVKKSSPSSEGFSATGSVSE